MSTQQISLPILSRVRTSPKNLRDVERALTHLDGIVAAPVNYATESATVVYDPTRVTTAEIVDALRRMGCDTPVEHLTLRSGDLWYATSTETVERILANGEGVVRVSAHLGAQTVAVDVLPGRVRANSLERLFHRFGFEGGKAGTATGESVFFLRSVVLIAMELLALWSAGAHAGVLVSPGSLHAPLVVVVLALTALWGVGWPFLRVAYSTVLLGEFDAAVIVALLASAFALLSVPISLIFPSPWLTDTGFLMATTLIAGWFIQRALAIWVWPRVRETTHKIAGASAAAAQVGTSPTNIVKGP